MARRRRNRFISQAAEEALVRYNPERSALMELLLSAKEDRRTTVRQARGTAASTIGEIDRTRPEVKRGYRDAGLAQARTAHLLDEETAGLGPVANSIRAGISLERATGARHLTEDRTEDLTDLGDRRVRAREGAQYAVQNAANVYQGELGKVQRRLLSLAQEEGAFTAGTARELRQAASDRKDKFKLERMGNSQQERNSLRSAGLDPDTGKPIKGGKLDPKAKAKNGKSPWSVEEQRKASDAIEKALSYVKKGDPGQGAVAERRAAIAKMLVQGLPGSTDPLTGKVSGGVPSLPAVYVSAALDLHFGRALSRTTVKRLHGRGVKVKDLGYPTRTKTGQYRSTIARPPLAKGNRNQSRPT